MAVWKLSTPRDFGFPWVVRSHGWFQCPPFYWDPEAEVLTRVEPDSAGRPRVLRVSQPCRGVLEVKVEGRAPSSRDRRRFELLLRRMLQLDEDIAPFHRLCRAHRPLRRLPGLGAGRILKAPTLWEDAAKSICGTNVLWSQAVRMISRVSELGEGVGELRTWPGPEAVLRAGERWLRSEARVGYRAESIVALAESLVSGRLDPAPADRGEGTAEELRELFVSIRGIGKATSHFLLALHGHFGALSVDSAVYRFMSDKYFEGRKPSEAEILEIYAPFGEWQALAYWFEFAQESWWPSLGLRL